MKKRKQSLVLGILVVCLAILVIGYIAVNQTAGEETESEEDIIELYSLDTDTAESLSFEYQDTQVSLVKEDDTWYLESDKKFPLNQTNVSTMLSTLNTISAERSVVDDAEDLSEYGLDQPAVTVSIELESGVTAKLQLGNEVPVQGGYYGIVDEDNHVYVMGEAYYSNFAITLSDLMTVEDAPSIDSTTITSFKLSDGKGTDFSAVMDNNSSWNIDGSYDKTMKGDSSKLQELFDNYSSLTYGDCVEYDCEDSSEYGISEDGARIDIEYYEQVEVEVDAGDDSSSDEQTEEDSDSQTETTTENQPREYHLLIGENDGAGNYYVQPEGSSYIYTMDETTVEDLLYVDGFDYIYSYIVNESVDTLDSIKIDIDGKETTISIDEETATDEDGNDSTEYTCKRNKEELDYDTFKDAYTSLRGLSYMAEINKDKIKGDAVYATMTIKSTSGERTIQFVQYDDDNYYRVSVDGDMYFLAEKKEVESALQKMVE